MIDEHQKLSHTRSLDLKRGKQIQERPEILGVGSQWGGEGKSLAAEKRRSSGHNTTKHPTTVRKVSDATTGWKASRVEGTRQWGGGRRDGGHDNRELDPASTEALQSGNSPLRRGGNGKIKKKGARRGDKGRDQARETHNLGE